MGPFYIYFDESPLNRVTSSKLALGSGELLRLLSFWFHFYSGKEFVIYTNARNLAIGAILAWLDNK